MKYLIYLTAIFFSMTGVNGQEKFNGVFTDGNTYITLLHDFVVYTLKHESDIIGPYDLYNGTYTVERGMIFLKPLGKNEGKTYQLKILDDYRLLVINLDSFEINKILYCTSKLYLNGYTKEVINYNSAWKRNGDYMLLDSTGKRLKKIKYENGKPVH